MIAYDDLAREVPIPFNDRADLPERIKGLYIETRSTSIILLNRNLESPLERMCVLAEELGHHYTTVGHIIDQSDIINRKQEKKACNWGYERLVPLSSFVQAFEANVRNRHEFADLIGVTEDFLDYSISHYLEVYGLYVKYEDYAIRLDPLGVTKIL